MAFLPFLRIRFGISSLSLQILTLPQLPCNPKGSSPYNFRFRLPHADESHLHTFRSHRHHRLSFQIRYLSFRFGSLIKRRYQKANTILIIIIWFLVIISKRQDAVRTDHQWQTVIIMRLFLPFSSAHICSGDQIIPGSLRKIILHFTVLFKIGATNRESPNIYCDPGYHMHDPPGNPGTSGAVPDGLLCVSAQPARTGMASDDISD